MKIQSPRQFLARLAARRLARALSLGVALVAGNAFVSGPSARAATYTYIGGTTGVWSTPTVWSPNAVPGSGDIALFSGAAAQTVLLGGSQAALGLQFTATAGTTSVRASAAGQILSVGASGIQYGSTQTDIGGTGTAALIYSLAASQSFTGTGSGLIQFDSGALPTQQAITNGTGGAVVLTFDGAGVGSKNIFGYIDDGTLGGTTALTINTTGAFGGVGLIGNNTYSGGTTFTQGFLSLQNNTAIGIGALTFANSTVIKQITSGLLGGVFLINNNALNLNGTITLGGGQNINFGFGATTLQSATTLLFNGTNNPVTFTIGGDITGANNLTVGATGTNTNSLLVLNGANTGNSAANPITVLGQAVRFGSGALPTGTGSIVLNGGSLVVGPGLAYTTATSLLADARVTKTAGAIALAGDSSEVISLATAGGNISLGAALGSVARYTGTLTPNGTIYNVGGGGGTIVFSNTNTFTGTRSFTTNGAAFNTFGGGGTVVVNGVNNFDGNVGIGVGTLEVSSVGSVGTSSALGAPTGTNGTITFGTTGNVFSQFRYTGLGETTTRTLSFNSFSGSASSLDASGSGAINFAGTFTQSSGSTNRFLQLRGINTGANTIAGSIGVTGTAGGLNLTKAMRGNWTLTNTNNFAGTNASTSGIVINGGTLTADFTTNANILGATGTNLTLGGGTLAMVNTGAGTATQGIGNGATTPLVTLTANTGQSNVNVSGNGTAGSSVLTTGANFVRNANTFLNFNLSNGGQVATASTATSNGVLVGTGTPQAAFTVTDSTGTDFANANGTQIVKVGATTALPAAGSSSTVNYVLAGSQTLTASESANTVRIDTSGGGGTLTLGANSLTLTGGTLLMSGGNAYNVSGTRLAPAGGSINLANYGTGTLTIAAAVTDGAGSVTKVGPGLVDLTVAQAYTGATNIYGGVLRFSNATTGSGNIVLNTGGILEIGADLNGATAGDFSRQVGTGANQVQWANGDGGFSAFGANRAVNLTNNLATVGGQLVWGSTSGNNLVASPNASPAFVRDGFALLLSSSTSNATLDFQNPIDFVNMPRAVVVGDGSASVDAILSGVLSSSDYSGGLEKSGAGTLAVTAANTYTGETRILAGTLQIGNGGTTGSLAASSPIINNGTLAFNRTNTLTQGTDFAGTVSGSGAVVQLGTGTTILTGNNTYTGTTTVTAGTLLVNNVPVAGVGSGTGTGAVAVSNGGTLGGTGAMLGLTTINAGGTITGGTLGTVGTLTLQSGLAFTGASGSLATFAVDIGSGTNNSDRLAVSGVLDLSGANDQITFAGTPDGTSNYVLATYGSVSGTFNFGITPTGYVLRYNSNELDLVAVPEPSTWVLVAGLMVGAAAWTRRRRTGSFLG